MKRMTHTPKAGKPLPSAQLAREEAKSTKSVTKSVTSSEARTDTAADAVTVESLVIDKETEPLVGVLRARITPEMIAALETQIPTQPSGELALGMPNGIFCREAVGVGCFAERYWDLVDGIDACLAPHERRLGGDPGPELLYLADQCRRADAMLVQGSLPSGDALPSRAQKLLTEIRYACEVVVDDGIGDNKDVLVVGLRKQHDSAPKTIAEVTNALASYVTAARSLRAELSGLAGFNMANLDAAQAVVDHLLGRGTSTSTRATRIRRNRLLAMIRNRVTRVRKVARFTFRDYPDILREVASAHNRERRRAAKGGESEEIDGDDDLLDPTEEKTPPDDSSPDDDDDV